MLDLSVYPFTSKCFWILVYNSVLLTFKALTDEWTIYSNSGADY